MNIDTISGTKLKNLRERKKVSVKELATFVGVSPQAIYKWESGERKINKPTETALLLILLAKDINKLLKWKYAITC